MFWIISSIATFTVLGFQKEKREGKGDKKCQKCIWWNYNWKISKPEEGNRCPSIGGAVGPKQEETKQTYQDITIKMEKVKEKGEF